jgi:hypothetical protein
VSPATRPIESTESAEAHKHGVQRLLGGVRRQLPCGREEPVSRTPLWTRAQLGRVKKRLETAKRRVWGSGRLGEAQRAQRLCGQHGGVSWGAVAVLFCKQYQIPAEKRSMIRCVQRWGWVRCTCLKTFGIMGKGPLLVHCNRSPAPRPGVGSRGRGLIGEKFYAHVRGAFWELTPETETGRLCKIGSVFGG